MKPAATGARSVTVFRSRLDPSTSEEYLKIARHIAELAKAMPGYISHKTFTAEDGERVTIAEFADDASEQAWAHHPEHGKAMDLGRSRFYFDYNIKVCAVQRELVGGKGGGA